LEVTPKGFFTGENLLAKVTQNISDKFGVFGEKSFTHPKFACSYTYVQGLAKNIFAEGAKSDKIFTTRN